CSNRRTGISRSVVLTALAALPFAASLGFNAVSRAPQTPEHAGARPALVFDQYLVDLRTVRNMPRATAVYRFKNCGQSSARITKLTPSCGCLDPKLEKRIYRPGEIGEFALAVLTTHQEPGPHDYDVKIEYEDPEPRTATVAF